MASKEAEFAQVDCECSECKKDFPVVDPETSDADCLQVECPHCGRPLMLDRVSYWSASGLGDI